VPDASVGMSLRLLVTLSFAMLRISIMLSLNSSRRSGGNHGCCGEELLSRSRQNRRQARLDLARPSRAI